MTTRLFRPQRAWRWRTGVLIAVHLLIIAHDDWITNLDPLVAHKTARGISTTVAPSTFRSRVAKA